MAGSESEHFCEKSKIKHFKEKNLMFFYLKKSAGFRTHMKAIRGTI
jgi:hypothetical protein